MKVIWAFGLFLLTAPALAQVSEATDEQAAGQQRSRLQQLQEKALALMNAAQQLGNWEDQYLSIVDAMDRMYERNGWNSESDIFSMELAREVGAIPPWEAQARMDKLMEMIGDRYLLDENQQATLQERFFDINVDLFSRHSDRIMEYALDAIQTRAAGEPFTPEQIARWVELAEPVMQDARDSIRKEADRFMERLDPEQRELVSRDLQAADRRMGDMQRMSEKWKRGEWQPSDWGMEADPIQMQGQLGEGAEAGVAGKGGAPVAGGKEAGPAVAPGESRETQRPQQNSTPPPDDEWARYVREFIRKYGLNDEQQQRAWLIYRDAKERDVVFQRRFDRQLETVRSRGEAQSEPVQAAVREQTEKHQKERDRLFSQMKRRLERLPTRAQRRNAETTEAKPAPQEISSEAATQPAGEKQP